MPHHILKYKGRYMDWSTVTDSPHSPFLSRDQLIAHWVQRHSDGCLCELWRKLGKADEYGSSWANDDGTCCSAREVVDDNKAGPDQSELTMDQLWAVYGLDIPLPPETSEGESWSPFGLGEGPKIQVTLSAIRNVIHNIDQGKSGRHAAKGTLRLWLDAVKECMG